MTPKLFGPLMDSLFVYRNIFTMTQTLEFYFKRAIICMSAP